MFGWAAVVCIVMIAFAVVPGLLGTEFPVHPAGAVLITGASTGIGRHACLHVAAHSPFTAFCGVRTEAAAQELLRQNQHVRPLILDITIPQHIEHAVQQVVQAELPLVGLVNNAAIYHEGVIEHLNLDRLEQVLSTNILGTVRVTQAMIPLLRQAKGRVVNIGSIAGVIPAGMGAFPYSGSKFALEAFADALRHELEPQGMAVMLIQPGAIASNLFTNAQTAAVINEQDKLNYAGFYGPGYRNMINRVAAKADSPQLTSDAILHALVSSHPKSRQLLGQVDGVPTCIVKMLFAILPDRVADMLPIG